MKILNNSYRYKSFKVFILRSLPEIVNDIFIITYYFTISFFQKHTQKLCIVTAADESHFDSVCNLLRSLNTYEQDAILVFYDLGLSKSQVNFIKDRFSTVEYKRFNFNKYPSFVSKKDSDSKIGSYSWKSIIIKDSLDAYKINTLWLDAGCLVTKKLSLIRLILNNRGIYIASSVGKIIDWTHISSITKFGLNEKYLNKKNFASGMVGINPKKEKYISLIQKWVNFSLDEEIIAPEGSSRKNHRQDQAILTMLIYQNKVNLFLSKTHKIFGITIHNDPGLIYFWPDDDLNSDQIKLSSSLKENLITRTYKNAEFIIFSNLSDLRKINAIKKNGQKIVYLDLNNKKSFSNSNELSKKYHIDKVIDAKKSFKLDKNFIHSILDKLYE